MNLRKFRSLHAYEEQTDPRTGKAKRVMVYTGDYFALGLSPAERRGYLIRMWILWSLCALCYVGAASVNAVSSHMMYVGGFYLISVFPLALWGWAVFRLTRLKETFTQMDKEEVADRLHLMPGVTGALGVCALIGDIYFAIRGGWQIHTGLEVLFVSLLAAITVCSWAANVESSRHPSRKVEK